MSHADAASPSAILSAMVICICRGKDSSAWLYNVESRLSNVGANSPLTRGRLEEVAETRARNAFHLCSACESTDYLQVSTFSLEWPIRTVCFNGHVGRETNMKIGGDAFSIDSGEAITLMSQVAEHLRSLSARIQYGVFGPCRESGCGQPAAQLQVIGDDDILESWLDVGPLTVMRERPTAYGASVSQHWWVSTDDHGNQEVIVFQQDYMTSALKARGWYDLARGQAQALRSIPERSYGPG